MNPASRPEHLEEISWETQLRFIYHPDLLTLPGGSTLTALVVQCEQIEATPLNNGVFSPIAPRASSWMISLTGKRVREEIINDLLLFLICSVFGCAVVVQHCCSCSGHEQRRACRVIESSGLCWQTGAFLLLCKCKLPLLFKDLSHWL